MRFSRYSFPLFVLLIRHDIQQSIMRALNHKATFLTIQSRISSQFLSPSTKESDFFPLENLIFEYPRCTLDPDLESTTTETTHFQDDTTTVSRLYLARDLGLLPPTVELEEILVFYEDSQTHSKGLPVIKEEPVTALIEDDDFYENLLTTLMKLLNSSQRLIKTIENNILLL